MRPPSVTGAATAPPPPPATPPFPTYPTPPVQPPSVPVATARPYGPPTPSQWTVNRFGQHIPLPEHSFSLPSAPIAPTSEPLPPPPAPMRSPTRRNRFGQEIPLYLPNQANQPAVNVQQNTLMGYQPPLFTAGLPGGRSGQQSPPPNPPLTRFCLVHELRSLSSTVWCKNRL